MNTTPEEIGIWRNHMIVMHVDLIRQMFAQPFAISSDARLAKWEEQALTTSERFVAKSRN